MDEDTDQDMRFGAGKKWNYVELPMEIDKKPVYIRIKIGNKKSACDNFLCRRRLPASRKPA